MCTRSGFVIAVTTIDSIGLGALQPGRGFALYPIKYKASPFSTGMVLLTQQAAPLQAVVFRPIKGEVLDAVVTQVNKIGIFTQIGPLSCFVSKHVCSKKDLTKML